MSENVDRLLEELSALGQAEIGVVAVEFAQRVGAKFDTVVTTSSPVPSGPVVEEKTEFDVLLAVIADGKKIEVIKAVRELTGLGLKEAKDFVEKTGERLVKEGTTKEDAQRIKARLEQAGATAVLR